MDLYQKMDGWGASDAAAVRLVCESGKIYRQLPEYGSKKVIRFCAAPLCRRLSTLTQQRRRSDLLICITF